MKSFKSNDDFSEMLNDLEQQMEEKNQLDIFNNSIDILNHNLVKEAVHFFMNKHLRNDDDYDCHERFFYNQKDIIDFYNSYPNNDVGVKIHNEDGKFFCYELYRISVKNNKNNKNNKKETKEYA